MYPVSLMRVHYLSSCIWSPTATFVSQRNKGGEGEGGHPEWTACHLVKRQDLPWLAKAQWATLEPPTKFLVLLTPKTDTDLRVLSTTNLFWAFSSKNKSESYSSHGPHGLLRMRILFFSHILLYFFVCLSFSPCLKPGRAFFFIFLPSPSPKRESLFRDLKNAKIT